MYDLGDLVICIDPGMKYRGRIGIITAIHGKRNKRVTLEFRKTSVLLGPYDEWLLIDNIEKNTSFKLVKTLTMLEKIMYGVES